MNNLKKNKNLIFTISLILIVSMLVIPKENTQATTWEEQYGHSYEEFQNAEVIVSYPLRAELVDHPIVTENANCSNLLENSVGVSCILGGEVGKFIELSYNDLEFIELLSIFNKYDFSPIDYKEYPNGAGYYFADNTFMEDSVFSLGVDFIKLTEDEINNFLDLNYCVMSFNFEFNDDSELEIILHENLNVIVKSRNHISENEYKYNYELPYSLKDQNVYLFTEILNFIKNSTLSSISLDDYFQ